MKVLLFVALLISTQALKNGECNAATCKNVAFDCVNEDKCYSTMKQCLNTLKKELNQQKSDQNKYNEALDQFQTCMNNSLASGKVLSCAKNTCPASVVQFISNLFNINQSKSFISLLTDRLY